MQTTAPIIRTKVRLPFISAELVPRPRLQQQITEGLMRPLTLITAPAGFGKTTLVASCITDCGLPVAWLSLDKDDNKEERFLNYVIAALNQIDTALGEKAARLMTASNQILSEVVMTLIVNDLDAAGKQIALVLDDYHVIKNPAIHSAVVFLLEHCPTTFHMIIVSRSDPPLPLSRLRARGQTVELRAGDLSFTNAETKQFLNGFMGLQLDSTSVALLTKRTEGWITGLQMAALSMRDRKDIPAFIKGFSGTNRYILDYLLEEVLINLSPEIQRFLLYTSILDRLTASLCDATLGHAETASMADDNLMKPLEALTVSPSQNTLDYLAGANLFVIPLDDERLWYRYHHLFADLLRARVQQMLSSHDLAELHIRAAQWYEQNNLIYEAIHHASLTSNDEWVEQLIERNYIKMMQHEESSSIRSWTGKLRKELVYRRPLLCIHEAMSRAWFGQLNEAEDFLLHAEKHFQGENQTAEIRSMRGYAAYVKSRVTAMRGEVGQAIQLCLNARENVAEDNHALQGGIGVMLGYGYFLNGDFTSANRTLSQTIQSGTATGAVNTTIGAYCVLARLYAIQGQLNKSYELYQEAHRFIQGVGGQHLGATSVVNVGIAEVLYEWNMLGDALNHINHGLEDIPYWSKAGDIALAYTTRARIHHARGTTDVAFKDIKKASHMIHSNGVFPEARGAVETMQVRLLLAQGDRLEVGRWAESLGNDIISGNQPRFENELIHMTLARVYMMQNRFDEAMELLCCLEKDARSNERTGRLIGIMVLQALVQQEMGNAGETAILTHCLKIAQSERYARIFLDEGQPMRNLITRWLSNTDGSHLQDYAHHLLSLFEAEEQEESIPNFNLIDPLSQRELEVLHIMALGKTNQEIARQLFVTRGTIKAHTASIYRKLDVANRTEAVARARQLGIIP